MKGLLEMGDGRASTARFPPASKSTFLFCINSWPMESGPSWQGSASTTATAGVARTGWDISHWPTILVSLALPDRQNRGLRVLRDTYQFCGDGDGMVGNYYGQDIRLLNVSHGQVRRNLDPPGCELSKRTRISQRAANERTLVPLLKNSSRY